MTEKTYISPPKILTLCSTLSKIVYPGYNKNIVYGGFYLVQAIENQKTDTQLCIYANDSIVFVVYRGSSNKKDIITNIHIGHKEEAHGNYFTHEGIYQAARSVDKTVRAVLNDFPNHQIVLTGHSLGGGLAAELSLTLDTVKYCITFGAPCIGGMRNAARLEAIFKDESKFYLRVVNGSDIVPRLLDHRFGYIHSGELLYISNSGKLHYYPTESFMFWDRFNYKRFFGSGIKKHSADGYEKDICSIPNTDPVFMSLHYRWSN